MQEFYGGIILVVAAVLLVIAFFVNHKVVERQKRSGEESDQRHIIRGHGYRLAFWCMVIYFALCGGADQMSGFHWADQVTIVMVGIFLGVGVFAGYTIWKDAYLTDRQQPGKIGVVFLAIGALNLYYTYSMVKDGAQMVKDGMLTLYTINFWMGALFAVVGVLVLLKDKKKGKTNSPL